MCTVKSNHGELGALDCLEGELKLTRYWSVCVIIPLGSLGGGSCGLRGGDVEETAHGRWVVDCKNAQNSFWLGHLESHEP